MKNFELTSETINHDGRTLYRIRAIKSFGVVRAGDLGGWVESLDNLFDNGWVFDNGKVYDKACVFNNAKVYDEACVYDSAEVYGNADVFGNAEVCGDAEICGNAAVCGDKIEYSYQVFNIPTLKYNLTITPTLVRCGFKNFTHKKFKNLIHKKCGKVWLDDEGFTHNNFRNLIRKKSENVWLDGELELYISMLDVYYKICEIYNKVSVQ